MKLAFLYAGQGAQKAGMGLDLYEQFPVFSKSIDESAACVLFDLKQVMFGSDDTLLNRTEMTQPSLAAYAAGVTAVLDRAGIHPDVTLGLSLGEYSALHAAGVLTGEELIRLTAFRGQAMAECGAGIQTRMYAVLGLETAKTEELCREASRQAGEGEWVFVVNYNTVGQEVISGTEKAVGLAVELAKEAGARRCMPLKVSSAFHTPLMEPASEKLEQQLKKISLHPMQRPVVFNVTGRELAAEESIPELLVRQVKSPVRMRQSIEYLKQIGVTHAIEIGPGHALSGFVKRAVDGIQIMAVEDADSLRDVINTISEQ